MLLMLFSAAAKVQRHIANANAICSSIFNPCSHSGCQQGKFKQAFV